MDLRTFSRDAHATFVANAGTLVYDKKDVHVLDILPGKIAYKTPDNEKRHVRQLPPHGIFVPFDDEFVPPTIGRAGGYTLPEGIPVRRTMDELVVMGIGWYGEKYRLFFQTPLGNYVEYARTHNAAKPTIGLFREDIVKIEPPFDTDLWKTIVTPTSVHQMKWSGEINEIDTPGYIQDLKIALARAAKAHKADASAVYENPNPYDGDSCEEEQKGPLVTSHRPGSQRTTKKKEFEATVFLSGIPASKALSLEAVDKTTLSVYHEVMRSAGMDPETTILSTLKPSAPVDLGIHP